MSDNEAHQLLRVLIVEDSEIDAELLLRALARSRFEISSRRVETASALQEALESSRWDVVISDYSLPSLDAPAALSIVKQIGLDIPFIVVSGTVGEETAVEALKAGAHDFLAKGKLSRLIPAIERELREVKVREARRQVEQALGESEQRYRRIIETTSEGVWVLDAALQTTFVNQRMAHLLGCSVSEVLGRSLLDFVHDESLPRVASNLEQRTPGDHVEVRLNHKDGSELWVLLDSTSIYDASNRYEGALVMVMDVTARKRLEEQLLQAQKMEAIGSLAGGVAHDFNNLLSVILSYTSLILTGLKPGDPIAADLEEVKKAGERASDLTRQLLAFSRRQVFELRVLDLNQVLAGMHKMLRRLLPEHIDFSMLTEQPVGKVFADPGQVEQIIMNLVVNAQDAMPHGGKLTIETGDAVLDAAYAGLHLGVTPGRYIMLAVTDTGIGMDAATRARIFEPFFTTKGKDKGTGLGLSTVFGIVQQSGGHVWVYSEPGKGTSFKVYLPMTDDRSEVAVSSVPVPSTLRGSETVLLVEDDDSVRAVARTILRREGYNVLEAPNAGEALLTCENYGASIQLMITDVIMPRMTGRELADRLASIRPQMRVLYVSGYTENSVIHHGVLEAGIAFLQKPITPEALLRKVRKVLDAPARADSGSK